MHGLLQRLERKQSLPLDLLDIRGNLVRGWGCDGGFKCVISKVLERLAFLSLEALRKHNLIN